MRQHGQCRHFNAIQALLGTGNVQCSPGNSEPSGGKIVGVCMPVNHGRQRGIRKGIVQLGKINDLDKGLGRLVFLVPSTLVYLCAPDEGDISTRLLRPQFGMHHIQWPGDPGTEYQISHGDWIRLLRANGFEIEELIELQVPEDAETHQYYGFITAEWGRQWPPEEIWVTRLRE